MINRVGLAVAVLLASMAGVPAPAAVQPPCGSQTPTLSVTGELDTSREGGYVLVPFMVPAGTTKVRVRLCHDQSPSPLASTPQFQIKHTLDLGVYHARGASMAFEAASKTWSTAVDPTDGFYDRNEFRGWGGSSRLDASISPDAATDGFKPGPIPAGEWAAEIGVAAIAGPDEGDLDGSVAWRLEIFVSSDPADADGPWSPAGYDQVPANPNGGWYKGDFHVHATHSGSVATEVALAYAFSTRPQGGAGLDFITLSDYVTTRHWDEIGRLQATYPGKLVIRSAEVITYRGHVNNHASLRWADYRTGPIWERAADASLTPVRAARGAAGIFDDVHAAASGWTQVNHPTTFPSKVPGFSNICRGCSWEYTDAETDWSKVDAFEVSTGPGGYTEPKGNEPGPNPFAPPAIAWWDSLRRAGYGITAVGSSDSHRAGAEALTYSPIGEATTVVYAPQLSEAGIREGILAGHAYVKFFQSDGPDLRFNAIPDGGGASVMMGDELIAASATFSAQVLGAAPSPQPRVLLVLRDGVPVLSFPLADGDETFMFTGLVAGSYRLQLQRGSAIEALTNPITLVSG